MVTQDAQTFVALGQAVHLAAAEGALDDEELRDLTAALVAGILSGCMELDTYARVHEALALLLERAFEEPPGAFAPPPAPAGASSGGDEALGVYLEVVGDAWEKVSWDAEACGRLKGFVRRSFDLGGARFGVGGWFRAPLRLGADEVIRAARAAGLAVVSLEGALPAGPAEAVLENVDAAAGRGRVVLGWGERRTALDLGAPAAR